MKDERRIFFVHVPKAAGTSITKIIESQYPRTAIFGVPDERRPQIVQLFADLPDRVKIVAGHAPLWMRAHFKDPVRAITMLRRPTERIVSLYNYIARQPKHRWHRAVTSGEMSLLDCARKEEDRQAFYISGRSDFRQLSSTERLASAKQSLEHEFETFGLVERFPESLLLFNAALGWKVKGYARENVRTDARSSKPTPEELAEIGHITALDQELYAFAEQIFADRLAALGDVREQIEKIQANPMPTSVFGRLIGKLRLGR